MVSNTRQSKIKRQGRKRMAPEKPAPFFRLRSTDPMIPERIRKTVEPPLGARAFSHADQREEGKRAEVAMGRIVQTMERIAADIDSGAHKWTARFSKPDKAEFDDWFKQRVDQWKGPPPTRDDDVEDAEKWFRCSGLRDLARDARRRLAPKKWKTSGPNGRKARLFKK